MLSIPTGLRLPAQGCEERATLGTPLRASTTPKGLRPSPFSPSHGVATLSGLYSLSRGPQGSSSLATLGFVSNLFGIRYLFKYWHLRTRSKTLSPLSLLADLSDSIRLSTHGSSSALRRRQVAAIIDPPPTGSLA